MTARPRILVVEDEPAIADTIVYALTTDGFEPHWCATAGAALEAARGGDAALAILDVGLPDLNGFELFKQLQRLHPPLPAIFLTARAAEIDRVVGLELGADDYVAKPFSPRELVGARAHRPAPGRQGRGRRVARDAGRAAAWLRRRRRTQADPLPRPARWSWPASSTACSRR